MRDRSDSKQTIQTKLLRFVEGSVLYLGERSIVKMGNRFVITLPQEFKDLWLELSQTKKKVKVFIEI